MSKTILVVDDEPEIVRFVRAYLEDAGYRVVIAGEGQEALFVTRHEKPDLVILDLMMPGMDGYETIVHLGARYPDLPVVAYTAVAGTQAQDHCDQHGIPLLRKSGDTTALVDTLRQLTA